MARTNDVRAKVSLCSTCRSVVSVVNGRPVVQKGHRIVLTFPGEGAMPTAMAHAPDCPDMPPEDMFQGEMAAEHLL